MFVCNVRIGVCGFVAVTSIFFCQMHCMLVTILAAVLWKTQKEMLTNSAILYLQLFTGSSVI